MSLRTEKKNTNLRAYFEDDDTLVAVATSRDGFDNFINYFCLPGVWDQDSNTSWVDANQLKLILEDNQKS